MNHVTLTGAVFQPESRVAKSGMAVLTFRLSYYQGKGKDGKAAYGSIDVTAFGRLAQAWDSQLHDKDKVIVNRLIADDIGQELNLFANSNPGGQYIPDEEVPF